MLVSSVIALLSPGRAGRGGGIRTPTRGFGDRWSAVKPTPLSSMVPGGSSVNQFTLLFRFPVRLVFAAERAELLHLETLGGRLLVFCVRVVTVLTFLTLERDDFSWHFLTSRLIQNLADGTGADGAAAFADGKAQAFV